MFYTLTKTLLVLFLLGLTHTTAAQQLPALATLEGLSAEMQKYYLHQRPELVANFIDALHSTGFVQRATNISGVLGFFSEVFKENPDRLPQWQILISKQDEQTKSALERALLLSKSGGVLNSEGHSAELNDEYWGAFFASGKPEFLEKLVDQLRYWDERDDLNLFMAGATAKWSLASNARSEGRVHLILTDLKLNADKRTKELITELLAQDPAYVKQDIIEIIQKQGERGKWRQFP